MSKAEFIAELNGRLAVLTDEERRDILDEYEQHIDIKVMRGMSEDAAIADFGKIEELAADILEAYHVRADYAVADRERRGRTFGVRERFGKKAAFQPDISDQEAAAQQEKHGEEARRGAAEWLSRFGGGIWNGAKRIGAVIRNSCKKTGQGIMRGVKGAGSLLAAFLRKPFGRGRREEILTDEITKKDGEANGKPDERTNAGYTKKERRMEEKAHFSIGRAIAGFGRGCRNIAIWCLRWMWNLFCIGAGLLFGFGSCLVVFMLGVLVVLLILGYPLAGTTIAWLGLTMCMVSVTIWCFSMVIRSRKKCRKMTEKRKVGILLPAPDGQPDSDIAENGFEEKEEKVHA